MRCPRAVLCATLAIAACASNSSDSFDEIKRPLSGVGASVNGLASTCSFTDTTAVCTPRPNLEFDATYTVPAACPPQQMTSWTLMNYFGGPVARAPEINTFVISHQARGAAIAGFPAGSSPQFDICGDFSPPPPCGPPFTISVPDCYAQDLLYLALNQTLQVTQGDVASESLQMAGPWMDGDSGVGATGAQVGTTVPASQLSFTFGAGTAGSSFCGGIFPCYGSMTMTVAASLTTSAGDYTATVSVTDAGTNITRNLSVPIHVSACTPLPATCPTDACGWISGCGLARDCGACSGANVCSAGHCCPSRTIWDGDSCVQRCNCKPGFYCDFSGACVRNNTCKPGTCM